MKNSLSKKISSMLIIGSMLISANIIRAELKPHMFYEDIDSVEIKMISYRINQTRKMGFDRNKFDMEYDFQDSLDRVGKTGYMRSTTVLKKPLTLMMLMIILNELEPYSKEELDLFEKSVKSIKDEDIRCRIKIYIKPYSYMYTLNFEPIIAFASPVYIDIFDKKYHIGGLYPFLYYLSVLTAGNRIIIE